jgi:hypothetical protein
MWTTIESSRSALQEAQGESCRKRCIDEEVDPSRGGAAANPGRSKPGRIKHPIVPSKRPGTLRITNEEIYDLIFLPDVNVWLALTAARHFITNPR